MSDFPAVRRTKNLRIRDKFSYLYPSLAGSLFRQIFHVVESWGSVYHSFNQAGDLNARPYRERVYSRECWHFM